MKTNWKAVPNRYANRIDSGKLATLHGSVRSSWGFPGMYRVRAGPSAG
jgi:hypothetical protein